MDIKTNTELDIEFFKIQDKLNNTTAPGDFIKTYDFAKRLLNQYGLGARFIEKIYLLGYIDGRN